MTVSPGSTVVLPSATRTPFMPTMPPTDALWQSKVLQRSRGDGIVHGGNHLLIPLHHHRGEPDFRFARVVRTEECGRPRLVG